MHKALATRINRVPLANLCSTMTAHSPHLVVLTMRLSRAEIDMTAGVSAWAGSGNDVPGVSMPSIVLDARACAHCVSVNAVLHNNFGEPLATIILINGFAFDGQVIGTGFATPVPGVRVVFLTFTDSPAGTAPGIRTFGVYSP